MTWEDRRVLLTLRNPVERQILVELVQAPGLTLAEMRERTQTSLSTVSSHLRRLIALGMVESDKSSNYRQYRPVRPLRVALLLQRYQASFRDRLVDRFIETWEELFG
jgi:DNA-binding transcriptional ArsR family regulator